MHANNLLISGAMRLCAIGLPRLSLFRYRMIHDAASFRMLGEFSGRSARASVTPRGSS